MPEQSVQPFPGDQLGQQALSERESRVDVPAAPAQGDPRKSDERRKRAKRRVVLSLAIVATIIAVNVLVVAPLFQGGWTQFLASPEGTLFAQVEFIRDHPSPFAWDSQVNFGGDTLHAGAPALPYFLAVLSRAFPGVSISALYRALVGVFIVVGVLSFYLLVRYLTRREFTAIAATLYFSSAPFLFLLILPKTIRDIALTVGPAPWWIIDFLLGGEAKHVMSIAILPLALLAFLHAIRTNAFRYHLLASALMSAMLLSKWGSWPVAATFFLLFLFSETMLGRTLQKLRSAFWVALLTVGFMAFWVNPSFLASPVGAGESPFVWSYLVGFIPLGFVVLPIVATGLFFIFDRKPALQPLFISSVGTTVFFVVILSWVGSQQSVFADPLVFLPEFHLVESLLVGLALTWLVSLVGRTARMHLIPRQANAVLIASIAVAIGLLLAATTAQIRILKRSFQPVQTLATTAEWKVAERVNALSAAAGAPVRVLASGSAASWLPLVSPTVEVVGGVESSSRMNRSLSAALERLEKGLEPSDVEAYLKALRISHVIASESASSAVDKGFTFPEQFRALPALGMVSQEAGDAIYALTNPLSGLALPVDPQAVSALPSPFDPANPEHVRQYAAALEAGGGLPVRAAWRGTNELVLDGILPTARGVSVAVNANAGWRATMNGQPVPLERDPFGLILLRLPEGPSGTIQLVSGPTIYDRIGVGVSGLTLLVILFLVSPTVRRRLARRAAPGQVVAPGVLIPPKAGFVEMMVDTPEKLEATHERAKAYYRKEEDFDWVEATDNFQGIDTFFHRNREELVVKLVERFGVPGKTLDVGCGTGVVLRHLPAGSIGLDINPRAIEKAKENAPKAALVIADVEQIPFPDNMFSTVVCTEVLDRLPNPKRAMRELKRVLAPGGVIIGTVPRENPMWRLRLLSSYNPEAVPWRKEYKRPDAEELLAGFVVIQLSPALSYMTWVFVGRKP